MLISNAKKGNANVDTKSAALQSPVIIMSVYWQPNYSLILRLMVSRSKGSLILIVEPKTFSLAGQAVAL